MHQTATPKPGFGSGLLFALTLFTFVLAPALQAQNVNVAGALVGNGSYPTLGDAFTAINGGAQTGATITVSIVGNTTEAATAALNQNDWSTLSITPSGGAARTITGSFVGHLVELNGADNVSINGLNTGGNSLTISSTALGASTALRFVNDASNNLVTNCSLLGSGDASFGVVSFSSGTTTGNDGNTISNCNIGPAGAALPLNGIHSLGTSAAIDNSGNTITGNNISDFFSAGSATNGMNINTGNSGWTITNNKLFQTATRTYTTANTHNGINITSGTGYTISGNTIGFANASGTGTYAMAGTIATRFIAINLGLTAGAPASSVQGNTVTNIMLNTSSGATTLNGILCGINVTGGDANIGTITGNTLGGSSGVELLKAVATTTGGLVVGINSSSTGNISIQNNIIGGLFSSGITAAVAGSVTGINVSGVAVSMNISNNTIGNTTANNMQGGTLGLTTGSSLVSGINLPSIPTIATINNNTVQNLTSYGTGTSGFVRGIWTSLSSSSTASGWSISNNTITNLTTNAATTGISSGVCSALGIHHLSSQGCVISQNQISNIANINTTATTNIIVAGIMSANGTVTTTLGTDITRNRIWNLSNSTIGTTALTPPMVVGIGVRSGNSVTTIANNMISLGEGQTTNTSFIGIWNNNGSTPNPTSTNVYHNSVTIGGTAASGALPSFGYLRAQYISATANTVTVDVKNNILQNSRSGGTGQHFAISNNFNATTLSATGWASNFNVLNSADPNTIGHWTSAQTFAGWQAASAGDGSSISGTPVNFVNTATADLHVVFPPASVVESSGTPIASVTVDYDGQARASLSPVDIGADAGNFTNAPSIALTPLGPTCVSGARTLVATITDPDGVPTAGAGLPVLYWRINAGAYTAATATFLGSDQYSFSFGAGAAVGDNVFYYIAAQDNVGNVGTSPLAGSAGFTANPPAASTPPTSPYSYLIQTTLNGTYTVGASGTYPTLTAAVNAYNNSCLSGPVIFSLIDPSYTAETLPITINSNPDASATNTLTIKPTGISAITGSSAGSIIRINGGDFITIDGSSGSTVNSFCPPVVTASRDLTISNTNTGTSSAVIWISSAATGNGATNITIKNCNITGNAPTTTFAGIITSGTTFGGVAEAPNSNNTFENNAITASQYGIGLVGPTGNETNNKVKGNLIGSTVAASKIGFNGVALFQQQDVDCTFNNITGVVTSTTSTTSGIRVAGTFSGGSISNNTISDVKNTNTSGFGANGMQLNASTVTPASNLTIANNFISDVAADGFNGVSVADNGYGIIAVTGGGYNIHFNTVNMNTNQFDATSTDQPAAINITSGITTVSSISLLNNIFANNQTLASSGRFSIVVGSAINVFSAIDYNDYYSQGPNIGRFGATPILMPTLASIQTNLGSNLHSQNIAPVFVSGTDLHLQAGANPTLSCGGIQTAVNTDIDCNARTVTPTIGADQLPLTFAATVSVAETSGAANNDGVICNGATATLTANLSGTTTAPTYLWSNNETSASITVTAAGTYTVTVTDGGCSVSATASITVSPAPTPTIAVAETSGTANDDGTLCAGASATLTASGGTSYLWNTSETTAAISVNTAGTYTVVVTNANGCTASASTTITVNPLPTAAIAVAETSGTTDNDGVICAGTVATLTASGGTSYLWSNTETTAAINVTAAGTYTVIVTNANGCSATATTTITVNPLPTASISGTTSFCAGGSTTLTASGGSTYMWSNGSATASTTITTAGTFTVTVTNANGCTASTSTVTSVLAAPSFGSVVLTEPTTCVSTDGAINIAVAGATPQSYAWTTSGSGNIPAGEEDNEDPTGLTAGTYTVVVTATNGCTASTSYTLGIPTGCATCPTIGSVSVSTPLCSNTTTTLTASGLSNMGNTYGISFVVSSGSPYTGGVLLATVSNSALSGGGTTAVASVTLLPGSYTIYAILSPTPADPSCRPVASTVVTVNVPPTPGITVTETSGTTANDGILCQGASATLTGTGGTAYAWSTGANTAAITVNAAGTYTVTVTNANACSATTTTTITVNPLPTPGITVTETSGTTANDGAICQGASATLTGTGGTAYAWSTSATTAAITVNTAGTYTVTVTNANGCTATATTTITVNPLPTPGIAVTETSGTTANDGTICQGASATLTATGGTAYAWSTGANTAAVTVNTAGTYTVTVTNADGCSATATTTITVNPLPTAVTTVAETSGTTANDGIICVGASATITASGGTSYAWSTGASTAAITVNPAATTTYTVTVTNANGCSATATRTITVNPLPTAFALTGGGQRCDTDNQGVPVGLAGSQSGVNYQLQLNGNNVGAPVAGTGNPISFGGQLPAGTYTVIASNTTSGCTASMSGSVTISIISCGVSISDPCVCLNNATTLENGQFGEVITVNAPAGQTWTVTAINGLFSTASAAPPTAPTPINVGTVLSASGTTYTLSGRHIDAIGYTVTVSNGRGTSLSIGNSCAYPNPAITSDLTGPFCLYSDPVTLTGTPGDANFVSATFTVNGVPATTFDPGAGLGQYTIVYRVDGGVPKAAGANDPGCVQTVSQIVNVVATPSALSCNDFVNISLDVDCVTEITPDMILEGTYGCFDDYIVELDKTAPFGNGPWVPAVVGTADLGKTYQARVTHLVSGNKCWGEVKIEDKLAPVLSCQNVDLFCPITNYTPSYITNTLGIAAGTPTVTDCSSYTLTHVDTWVDLACGQTFNGQQNLSAYVERKWTAQDQFGNSSTCLQYIYFRRISLTQIVLPGDAEVDCTNPNTSPANTGAPTVTALGQTWTLWPNVGYCELNVTYTDQPLPVCDGTY
ncbi:MAG: hypothetical protein J0L99_06920, partial [Chitinophagales bacterium]|nr:hypothetical protein [Chitinophagales bacterium]